MERIYEIDKNFQVKTGTAHRDAVFLDPRLEPFRIYGLTYENGVFRRMPQATAKSVNPGVYYLHTNTAGGRLRFRTNSPYVIVNTVMSGVDQMHHFPLTGSAGFDLYADGEYACSLMPGADMRKGYESAAEFDDDRMREITIHFPLYANVKSLAVGVAKDAALLPAAPYRNAPPVVYYGSSITQGGCASRPGNAYTNILSRMLNADHINLGFSGSARAEDEMNAYLAGLDMSVFVLDYDHNAPDAAHLERTHEKLFLTVREKRPDLPVVMLTRPKFTLTKEELNRRAVVYRTYENALAAGDRNVYFMDGPALMALAGNEGTVDGCHPNDLGFYSMAKALYSVLNGLLNRAEGS